MSVFDTSNINVYLTSVIAGNRALQLAQSLVPISEGIHVTDCPTNADILVYIDNGYCGLSETRKYFEILRKLSHQKIVIYSETDWPLPWAPGAYPSISDSIGNEESFFSWCYLSASHSELYTRTLSNTERYYLFSFLGRKSTHPIREKVCRLHSQSTPCLDVDDAKTYFSNYSYCSTYYELIQKSKFVLCPRGFGRGSIRVFEAMALGRVPVIISDRWMEPLKPKLSSCSIRVQENDIESIPLILARREDEAEELGKKAYKLFQEYFAPEVFLKQLIQESHKRSKAINIESLLIKSLIRNSFNPRHFKTWIRHQVLGHQV